MVMLLNFSMLIGLASSPTWHLDITISQEQLSVTAE